MANVISPLSHVRLNVAHVHPDFRGKLYFILGPGLGDTVNGFRILHEVHALYPHAHLVVYADPRWNNLYQLLPELQHIRIRYLGEAPSGELQGKVKQTPYHHVFRSITQDIQSELDQSTSFVALGDFKCLDQLAKKETGIVMRARAIGLNLPPDRERPFLPIGAKQVESASEFLKSCGLTAGEYIAVAPHTFSDKMWDHKAWEELIDEIWTKMHLPVLIIGVSGYPFLKGSRVREAMRLPLSVVAGLLYHAKGFVGLDSGITHLAACFDVPIVTLNPQGKFPPFLVEAHSPFRWTHLTPRVYGQCPITADSVIELVEHALQHQYPQSCPVCQGFPFVLKAYKGRIVYLCRCGLIFFDYEKPSEDAPVVFDPTKSFMVPQTIHGIYGLKTFLMKRKEKTESRVGEGLSIRFVHWDAQAFDPDTLLHMASHYDLWWTWDAMVGFLEQCGWTISRNEIESHKPPEGGMCSITVWIMPRAGRSPKAVWKVPWSDQILDMKATLYEDWLRWGTFGKKEELEDLGWAIANEQNPKEGRDMLRLALRLGPRGRTLRRWCRAEWKALW